MDLHVFPFPIPFPLPDILVHWKYVFFSFLQIAYVNI